MTVPALLTHVLTRHTTLVCRVMVRVMASPTTPRTQPADPTTTIFYVGNPAHVDVGDSARSFARWVSSKAQPQPSPQPQPQTPRPALTATQPQPKPKPGPWRPPALGANHLVVSAP